MKTKDKIIASAKTIFHQKGFEGARMQEIADASGVNKALLHYHFTSKEKLFQAVLLGAMMEMFPAILSTLNGPKPLRHKIELVVDMYLDFLTLNPRMPLFVLNEINQNPQFILQNLQGAAQKPTHFIAQVEKAVAKKEIMAVGPFHLIADIIGLCAFPFIAKPILQLIGSMDEKEFALFIAERKKHILQLLFNGLFLNQH